MTEPLRLTRRGRIVLRALPLLVVFASSVTTLVARAGGDGGPAAVAQGPATSPAATPTASPTPGRTTAPPRPAPSATPTPAPTATPKPSARPTRTAYAATGDLVVAPGSSAVHGNGRLRRFSVEVEKGLAIDPAAFAAVVESVLFDPRGWAAEMSFQRVSSGPVAFRVTLASPRTTDRLCAPLDTGGIYSCWDGARAVLNAMRWFEGARSYAGDLASYRTYMVNHEVGHGLGHGHRTSCGAGGLAPVMMQQTKSLYGSRRNPWPLAGER